MSLVETIGSPYIQITEESHRSEKGTSAVYVSDWVVSLSLIPYPGSRTADAVAHVRRVRKA